jgi:hypothetical protein
MPQYVVSGFHGTVLVGECLGRRPIVMTTLFLAVGAFDCLLHARRTIRQLANDAEANMFEEYLHGARIRALILDGPFQNDRVRRFVTPNSPGGFIAEQILSGGYLDQRNPLTIGRVLEPPDSADSRD